jgi:ankyrin repeat protein
LRIREAIDSGKSQQHIEQLQTADQVAYAVNSTFMSGLILIEVLDYRMASGWAMDRSPGEMSSYKVIPANLTNFSLNPFRGAGCVTLNIYGVQLGADKIGHLADEGMGLYGFYRQARNRGQSEEQALRYMVNTAINDPLMGEAKMLGYWIASDYSNADLCANYLGFVFYRNLTEPQMLKGELRPPMLLRDGPYWKIAPHIRPDSRFLEWFVCDQLDEAYNSGLFLTNCREAVRQRAAENFQGILEHRTDRWGNRRSQAWFVAHEREMRTYYGFDYGHDGDDSNLIQLSKVCFPLPNDPAARDQVGRLPIHRAVASGDIAVVRQLLIQGADVNAPIRSKESVNSNWGDTPLHMAGADGQEQIAKLLIEYGADVNRRNDRGNTPLHRAVVFPNVMKVLLDAGAQVDIADVQGRTPLHWASMGIATASAQMLIDHGADVTARDGQGQTPLHYAAHWADGLTLKLLLAHRADPNSRDNLGATPLHVAAAERRSAAAETLLQAGASANARDDFGCSPLHDAARTGAEDVVALLLNEGAQPALADAFGTTPLHLACRNGYEAVAVMLTRRGANPALVAGTSLTPIDEARRAGYAALADELSTMPQSVDFSF